MVDRHGRYSEAGQFLTTAAGVPAEADPGIQARVLLGAAWSAYHLGDNRRAAPLAADGIARARQAGEPQLEVWGRNLLAGLAWSAGDADRIVAEIEASQGLSGQADPALAARAEILLANAAFLAGDLAEQDGTAVRAIELARTAAGQEGLVLALTASVDVRDRRSGHPARHRGRARRGRDLTAARPDRFAETAMHHWRAGLFATLGQLEAAETGGRAVLGRGTRRRRPAGGIPRSASRGPRRRRQGRYRCRYWRAAPGRRRRRAASGSSCSCPPFWPPGVHGRHRR